MKLQNYYSPPQSVVFQNSNKINYPSFSNSKLSKSPTLQTFLQQTLYFYQIQQYFQRQTPIKVTNYKEESSKFKENTEENINLSKHCSDKKVFYYTKSNQIQVNPKQQAVRYQNSSAKQQNVTLDEQKNINYFSSSNLQPIQQSKPSHQQVDHSQCNEIISYLQEKIQLLLSEIEKLSKVIEIINKEKAATKKSMQFSEKEKNIISLCEDNIQNLQNQLAKQTSENAELKSQLKEFSNIEIMQKDLQTQMTLLQKENQELYDKLEEQKNKKLIEHKTVFVELETNNMKESLMTFDQTEETKTRVIEQITVQQVQQQNPKLYRPDVKPFHRQNSYLKQNPKDGKFKKFEYSQNILSKILKNDEKGKNTTTTTITNQQESIRKQNSMLDSSKKRVQPQRKIKL